jgi:hypothetical protein
LDRQVRQLLRDRFQAFTDVIELTGHPPERRAVTFGVPDQE